MSATAGTAAAAAAAADVVDPNNTMTFFTDWGTQLDGYVQTVIQFVIGFVSSYWLNFRDLGNKFDRVLHAMALGIQNVDHFVVAMLETSHKSDYMLQTLRTTFQQVEQGWDDFVHSKTAKMYLPELKYMKGWKASELGLLVLILLLTVSWYHIRNERELRHAFPQTMIQYKKEYTKRKKSKQEKKKQKKNSKKGNPPSRKEEEDDPEETDAKSRTISFRITPNIQGLQFSTGTSWERRIQTLAMFSCSLAFVLPGTVVCYASVLHFGILLPLHVFILHEDDDYSTSNTDSLPPWYVMKTGWTCGLIWLYLLYSYGIDTAATTGARYPYLRSTSSTGTTTTTTKTPATVGAVVAGWWERGSHYWWSAACDFLPVVLVKTADLPATKKHVVGNLVYTLPASYVLGYHPHGIIAVGAFCAFATNGVRTIDLSNGAHGEEHHHLQTAINNYNRNATEEEVEVDQQETSSELFAAEHPPQQRPPLRLSALELLQAQVETKTNLRGFSALFPKLDRRLVTLPINFRTPFLRDYFLGMGAINSSKATFRNYLNMDLPISGERTTNPTIGRAMCVVVGGAAESLLAQENTMQLVLHKRRGFVREAIMADANLVPVLGFGETSLYTLYDDEDADNNEDDQNNTTHEPTTMTKKMVSTLQNFVKNTFGVAVPLFTGRSIFFKSLGVMPKRKPVVVVVGKPIEPPTTRDLKGLSRKKFNPIIDRQTDEPLNDHGRILKEWHTKYVEELESLYHTYKDAQWNHPGQNRHQSLRIVR